MQAYTEKIWEHYLETNLSYLVAILTGFHVFFLFFGSYVTANFNAMEL